MPPIASAARLTSAIRNSPAATPSASSSDRTRSNFLRSALISAAGANVFFAAGDWPVGLLFVGLFTVYFFDFFASIGLRLGELGLGFFHLVTGAWLMYLAYATAVDFAIGYHWRV